ncbi:hypothetical protein [Nocardia arizonensis]|uniref:PD-(D/E)XK nuclease domain-containing protein n=1 Tax=Nocardia arizonensis TaxID=1141647 RepID=UPI0006D24D63|nr:hypothetical protein [Nocardia arizonensis]
MASEIRIQMLRQALDRAESIMAVHYASGNLYKAKDSPVPVTCISVTILSDGSTRAFSLADMKGESVEERETALLRGFFDFLDDYQDAKLVHWNMDKADYGFDALVHRYRWLTGGEPPYSPSPDRLFDLDQMLSETYGDGYVPHPKLTNLAALNKILPRYWIPGKEEAEKSESGDYAAIQRSSSEKSRAIGQLFREFASGSLVTENSAGAVEFAGAQIDAVKIVLEIANRMLYVERSLCRRHDKRETLRVKDEYDVQDLLRSLLVLFFDDVREENWVPDYAGGSARIDFTLPDFGTAVEVKKSRPTLNARKVGEELIVDRDKYAKHPDISHLVCIVIDHEGQLGNPRGLEKDLSREATAEGIAVTVRIVDR